MGRRWRKNKYLPLRECSTAVSMNSTIVWLLNLVQDPKLKFPDQIKAKIINYSKYESKIKQAKTEENHNTSC